MEYLWDSDHIACVSNIESSKAEIGVALQWRLNTKKMEGASPRP